MPKLVIIVLNWNGADDTIACLDSLLKCKDDFYTVVVDNGSTDNSVEKITDFLLSKDQNVIHVCRGNMLENNPAKHDFFIYNVGENLGFAKGNNEAVKMVANYNPEYFLLLNNDTIVESDFISKLLYFKRKNGDYKVLTPLICYESKRNIVWNAGGKQFFGLRKYYYANVPKRKISENKFIDITFVTGCALFFDKSILNAEGGVFTERFFFGEEDFDFCLRMNKNQIKMACVLDSLIYHKVSSSTSEHSSMGKLYVHYLNRFIDIRLNTSSLFFLFWCGLNFLHMLRLLGKQGFTRRQTFDFFKKVFCTSICKDSVSHADFVKALGLKD